MRDRIAIAVAVLLGAVAAVAIFLHVDRLKKEYEQGGKRVEVAVSKVNLGPGSQLVGDSFEIRSMDGTAARMVGEIVRREDVTNYIGRKVVQRVTAGQVLLRQHFGSSEDRPLPVESGSRTVTIPVDQVSGVAGMLRPGHHVDVLVSMEGRGTDPRVVLLQSRAPILAVGSITDPMELMGRGGIGYATVTIKAPTQQARRIALAQQVGRVFLQYRSPAEAGEEAAGTAVGLEELLGREAGR